MHWSIPLSTALILLYSSLYPVDSLRYDVVIVGAGASGLAAAGRLLSRNVTNILILEARNRTGGRISTIQLGREPIDMGAQYVYAVDGNTVYEMMKKSKLSYTSPQREVKVLGSSDKILNKAILDDLMNIPKVKQPLKYQSYINYFMPEFTKMVAAKGLGKTEAKAYLDVARKLFSIHHGEDMDKVGAWGVVKYRETGSGRGLMWKNGFQTLIDLLLSDNSGAKESSLGKKLLLNKEVIGLRWQDDGGHVTCKDGTSYQFAKVILTLPLGVLKKMQPTFFSPLLPKYKTDTIETLGFGISNKIFLQFEKNVTDNKNILFGMSQKKRRKLKNTLNMRWPTKLSGFYPTRDSGNILTSWIVGNDSLEMEYLNDDLVTNGTLSVLENLLGRILEKPKLLLRSKWGTDPFSFGSYSFRTIESEQMNLTHLDLSLPLMNSRNEPVVMFAGEATHEYHYGTVHGAIESGWREAERCLKLKN